MTIEWYGEGCFKLQSSDFTILTDPFDKQTGLNPPRIKPKIIIKTLNSFPPQSLSEDSFSILGPGEYNINNINIAGFFLAKESTEKFLKTVYKIEMEKINMCLLGHITEELEPDIIEQLEEIDILFFPAGGSPFISQTDVLKTIKKIEPKIAIPSFFKIHGLKRKSDDIKMFLDEFNCKKEGGFQKLNKFIAKKKDLSDIKTTQIAVLSQ